MNTEQAALVELLAEADALFVPMRSWAGQRPANTTAARRRYIATGLPWASGETSGAARLAAMRTLERLARAGWVTLARVPGQQGRAVRLTAAGDALGRRLAGLPDLLAGWAVTAEVSNRTKRRDKARTVPDVWLCEQKLIGPAADDTERGRLLVNVEELALPALVAGYLDSASTLRRNVFYAVTERGWQWLATGEPPNAEPDEADADARALYYATIAVALERLGTEQPERRRDLGAVPLPASADGVLIGCWAVV